MANKTIKFYGRGFGTTPAAINVVYNGNTVYTGEVPTVDEPPSALPDVPVDQLSFLFSLDVPVEYSGTAPMSVETTAGSVTLGSELTNYKLLKNPVFTPEQWAIIIDPTKVPESLQIRVDLATPAFTSEEIALLQDTLVSQTEKQEVVTAHNVQNWVNSGTEFNGINNETKTDVKLNGVVQDPVRWEDESGIWYWLIPEGSTLSFQYEIDSSLPA